MNESPSRSSAEITRLLHAFRGGEAGAAEQLFPLIYDELRLIARRRLGSRAPGQTLDTVGLVHEAYLRLFDQTALAWEDRAHFFAVVALAMRQIIVDHARRRLAQKRGGGQSPIDLEAAAVIAEHPPEEILALHEALERLQELDPRLARVVELRFFAGFTLEEIGEMQGVSPRTVKRDWRKARALLYESLRGGTGPG
jgi:RNA polymerase sigma factor (TIGR02999 family)